MIATNKLLPSTVLSIGLANAHLEVLLILPHKSTGIIIAISYNDKKKLKPNNGFRIDH